MFSALTGWSVRGKATDVNTITPNPAVTLLQEDYRAPEFNIDDYRPLKVRCIGAGFSGIICALRFRQKIPNLDFQIYEKQAGVGGTWYANKYPGVACDVPSHCYQYSFEDHTQWSKFYSCGAEIQASIERVVDKYKLRDCIRLQHELTYAKWDERSGKWTIRVRYTGNGNKQVAEIEETCDILVLGVGSLCRWNWPKIEGLKDFKGLLAHTADYTIDDKDVEGKRVGVIGNGSSGIQVVAAVHPKVKTLVNYGRQKTWIAPDFGITETKAQLGRDPSDTNQNFTPEELERLKNPEFAKKFRHALEHDINVFHMLSIRNSEMQKQAKAQFEAEMKSHLANKPELAEKMIPDFSVFCRRLTPGNGYLEALCSNNTTYETTPIKRITRTGVELKDGRRNDLDVLILATGFDVSYRYPFDVFGRNNIKLNDRWSPRAEAYMSIAVDGFPNMFLMYGPGSGLNTNSTISMLETQAMYIVKCVAKLQRERLKAMTPKKEAMDDWMQHMRHYFPKTVYMDKCKAWYTSDDGTVVGLWPGSNLHAMKALENPRWEDYEYERIDKTKNRLYWLGDGQTVNEKNMTGDLAWYLNDVDAPPVPA
ncbi:FAD/NAD-P-binding domain-containing protein [Irpex rosettiformis]|uniref:FAD/NAD-P-binding domain-containing protein n=1 Tax=Irpex rosettiformis TaxID=378272 RepID=A0ACB8UAN2_9APHY|nr:FAD/NAD-P-binding domain-containing protein [Irpex rosettiformis]